MQTSQLNTILESSTQEIFSEMLGINAQRHAESQRIAIACHGSRLELMINGYPYEIGILSEAEGANTIANLMYGLDDELWSSDEIVDAMGEMANLIAGRVKAKLSRDDIKIELSTPQSLDGGFADKQLLEFHDSTIEFSVFMDMVKPKELNKNECC